MKKRCSQRTVQRLPAVFSGLPNFKNEILVISKPAWPAATVYPHLSCTLNKIMERRPEKTASVGWHRGEIASFFLSFSLVRFFWTSKRNEQNEILTAWKKGYDSQE